MNEEIANLKTKVQVGSSEQLLVIGKHIFKFLEIFGKVPLFWFFYIDSSG